MIDVNIPKAKIIEFYPDPNEVTSYNEPIIKFLKELPNSQKIVENIYKSEGEALWKNTHILIAKEKDDSKLKSNPVSNNSLNNNYKYILLPFLKNKLIRSVLISKVDEKNNIISTKFLRSNDYAKFGFKKNADKLSADELMSFIISENVRILNLKNFLIYDKRLFPVNSNNVSNKPRTLTVKEITTGSGSSNRVEFLPSHTEILTVKCMYFNMQCSGDLVGCPPGQSGSDCMPLCPGSICVSLTQYENDEFIPDLTNYSDGFLTGLNDPFGSGGGGEVTSTLIFDANRPFSDITTVYNEYDELKFSNTVEITDIVDGIPSTGIIKRIGYSPDRHPIDEDLFYSTSGDISFLDPYILQKDYQGLINEMKTLFSITTIFDNDLKQVGIEMINKLLSNTSINNYFESQVLNKKVEESASTYYYLKLFGERLADRLRNSSGDINQVFEINMGTDRPKYSSLHHKFHGLQILINDTESTSIDLDNFEIDANGRWEADITVTIIDHFGLDKNDAMTYSGYHAGFGAWYLLQYRSGKIPFKTKIVFRKKIIGFL